MNENRLLPKQKTSRRIGVGIQHSNSNGTFYTVPNHARFFYALFPGYYRHVQGSSLKAVVAHSRCYGVLKPRRPAVFQPPEASVISTANNGGNHAKSRTQTYILSIPQTRAQIPANDHYRRSSRQRLEGLIMCDCSEILDVEYHIYRVDTLTRIAIAMSEDDDATYLISDLVRKEFLRLKEAFYNEDKEAA